MTAIKRLIKEFEELKKIESKDFGARPIENENWFLWEAYLKGPKESLYEGGCFKLNIKFPVEFPWKPPKIYFITKIYHPNFNYNSGFICCCALDYLEDSWNPKITIIQILKDIQSLLVNPNLDKICGLGNEEAAKLYIENRSEFESIAKQWTEKYGSAN